MAKRDHPVFYSDEINDDFGKRHIRVDAYKGKKSMVRKGLYAFVSNLFYYSVVVPLLFPFLHLSGFKIQGKENLKAIRNATKGRFFLYANHAGVKDVIGNYLLAFPYRLTTIGYSDAMDKGIRRWLVPLLGYLPLPVDLHDLGKFLNAMKYYLNEKKQPIAIFPEAHLWPQYTGVRNFKRASFRYPVSLDVPVLPVFYARRKRKGLWKLFPKPRITAIIGKPIYPPKGMDVSFATKAMGDACYESLLAMSKSIEQEEYWHYVYRPLHDPKEKDEA